VSVTKALICGAFIAATPSVARGQDRPQPSPSPSSSPAAPRYEESIDVVGRITIPETASTATKLQVPLQTLPLSVSSVSAPVLQAQDARVLGDALKNTPGVNVATGFGVFDFFTLRGFDSLSSSLVLTDGAGEPESSFYHLYNVRRVEVLRGPAAYLYGGSPLAGTVNLIRKQPAPGRFADVQLSGGSFSTFEGQLDANYGAANGRTALRLNALYQEADNYRDDKASRVFAINPTFTWRIDERTPLTLNVEWVDNSFEPDVGLPIIGHAAADVPRTRSYQSPFDTSEQGLLRLRVDFETRLGRNGTLHNKLYYTDLDWRSDGTLFNGAFPGFAGDFVLVRTLSMLDDRQKLLGNQLEGSWSFATGGVRHTLLAGFEASRLQDDYTLDVGALPPIAVFDPIETATQSPPPLAGFGFAGDTKALVLAPYVSDQVALGEKLRVLAAARFDSLDYEDTITRTRRESSQWSPSLGLLFAATPSLSLYGNFGKAFAPPSSLVVGEREPERTTQYEAGAKARLFGGRLQLAAAAFQLEKENVAIPDSSGVTRQQGTQESKGIEVEAQARLADDWFAFASYAFTDALLTEFREQVVYSLNPPLFAVLDRSGNRVPFAPRNLFNLWTQREWRNGLGVAAGARYVCTQFIAEDNEFKIREHWLFDAALSYRRGRARLRLNFKNLGDRDYYTRGFSNTAVIPANPFAVYGAVQLSLGSHR
jgi:iron complex outermembrane receptor protein